MLRHVGLQLVKTFLALTATHNFTNARHEQIHGGHGLAVVIQSHVEWLDVFGVIKHSDRTPAVFFREPALVFTLQVLTVGYRIFK